MTLQNLSRRILVLAALVGLFNIVAPVYADTDAWNGTTLRPYFGIGTQENPFQIKSAEEFAFLMQNYDYNNGICYKMYYKLVCDIDMSACPWTFGMNYTNNKSFRAHFDGDGHKISNINITVNDENFEQNIGIFPQLGGDEEFVSGIENLEIEGLNITFAKKKFTGKKSFNIGGLVGQMFRNSYIRNCIVNGMKVNDGGASIDLGSEGKMNVASVVAVKKNDFGGEETEDLENVNVINCYGLASADLGNTKGENFKMELEQGNKVEQTINGFKWNKKLNNGISFHPVTVVVKEVSSDANGRNFEAEITEGKNNIASYRWLVDGKVQNAKTTECTVPHDVKDRSIAIEVLDSKGKVIGSDAEYIEPADLKVAISAIKTGNNYTLMSQIIGEGSNALATDFLYEWKDMTDNEKTVGSSASLVGALPGHTYLLEATHRRWKFCRIGNYYSFASPIYVCLNGITKKNASKYTIDGVTTYPAGDDMNDGKSPEKAVSSLKKAYSLLKSDKMGGNLIVIMGDYSEDVFNKFEDEDYQYPNRNYFVKNKKAIITGQYGNITNGMLQMATCSAVIDAATRFDNITFHRGTNQFYRLEILAQENDLTFGHGIHFLDYSSITGERGLITGTYASNVTIFGGFLNYNNPAATHKENTIKLLSGYYGRVVAGGQFSKVVEETGNIVGSPRNPIRTNIVIDICNTKNPNKETYDVALAVTGQTNGSCYAVTNLEIGGSSRVGRAVGGNLGYGRKTVIKKKNGSKIDSPTDSFFGQSTISISGGNINEIYGTNLGRSGRLDNIGILVNDTVSTYFYGKSIVNISGGRVRNTIYAAGGGGVTGLAYDDKHHTNDSYIPYTLSNGEIAYGDYFKAKGKMPKVFIKADSIIDLSKTSVTVNISGFARMHGTVYGGGYGYSNQIHTSMATSYAGNLYGDSYINVTGGECYGYIYGGGRGSTAYFDNNDLSGYPVMNGVKKDKTYFANLAVVHGSTNVNITGGKVEGIVFAGGEGSYYRATSDYDPANATTGMAGVIGTTNLHIGGNAVLEDFVFGGGNYGNIIKSESHDESGSANVSITGGKFKNSIFGGGHGVVDIYHPERSIIADVEGDTHVTISGGEFEYTPEPSRYDSIRYFGIYGSGRNGSIVHGSSYINITKSLLSQKFIEDTKLDSDPEGKAWNRRYTICGGGFGEITDVNGSTEVVIDLKDGGKVLDVFGGGLLGNVAGSSHVTIKGKTNARNVYGGGLSGYIGLSDSYLNGYIYDQHNETRDYQTSSTVDFLSGSAWQVCGGGLMGNIAGETFVNIGSYDASANNNININNVYGGNDVTGTVAGSNNPLYGTNINIYGGTISGNVFGSGNGQYGIYNQTKAEVTLENLQNAAIGREHPHVASVNINISGVDEKNKAKILGSLYLGGNNTTIGLFEKSDADRPEYGLLREKLVPNSGHAHLNIGSHVYISNLIMGSNGDKLMDYIPYYTIDGTSWIKGFESQEAFEEYCKSVDMPCTPALTFNADRTLTAPGLMDAKNITVDNFTGGGSSGSMTSDSLYQYTLPAGMTVTGNVIGGCQNAHFKYIEEEGEEQGKVREYTGGFIPYSTENGLTDRLQLDIFCKFDSLRLVEENGEKYLKGVNIFGGCSDYGIIKGSTNVILHSDMVGEGYDNTDKLFALVKNNEIKGCEVFGGGKGKDTRVLGRSNVTLSKILHEDVEYSPKAIGVYGGGRNGGVEGGSAVCIFDGIVHRAFAGASNTYVNGGAFIKVGDKNSKDGAIAINTVYGGNDVCGEVSLGSFTNAKGEEVRSCSYVLIEESDAVRPQIRDVYAGGNGCYENTYNDSLPRPDIDVTYLDIRGGNINRAFGGSNESSVRKNSTIDVDFDGYVKYFYGGNNQTDMTVQPVWNLYRGKVGTLYGGCNLANVYYYNEAEDRLVNPGRGEHPGLYLNLDHEGFSADNVFGGCRMGTVRAHKMVNGKYEPVIFADNQYGTTINIKAGKFGRVFGGNDISGRIYNGTHIQIEGGEIEEVYGAGNGEYIYQYSTDVENVTESFDVATKQNYYKVPANPELGANATDFQKIATINEHRPSIIKSFIEIGGGMLNGSRQIAKITKAVYGGGNCATINAYKAVSGDLILSIGDYCQIENLFFGSNGENHIKASYIKNLFDFNKIGSLAQTDENGRTLLDYHMDAVMMQGLPKDFQFNRSYANCTIGSFFLGGNRGSITTQGDINIDFPRSLKITDKIVGGSNRSDILIAAQEIGRDGEDDLISNGGILWTGVSSKPNITLGVRSFVDANGEEIVAQVYPGCYMSGKVEGVIHVNIDE